MQWLHVAIPPFFKAVQLFRLAGSKAAHLCATQLMREVKFRGHNPGESSWELPAGNDWLPTSCTYRLAVTMLPSTHSVAGVSTVSKSNLYILVLVFLTTISLVYFIQELQYALWMLSTGDLL